MTKILGCKFLWHDSAVFLIDTKKKDIFAISTERITPKKHDPQSILPVLKKYPGLRKANYFVHSSTDLVKIDRFIASRVYNILESMGDFPYIKQRSEYVMKLKNRDIGAWFNFISRNIFNPWLYEILFLYVKKQNYW